MRGDTHGIRVLRGSPSHEELAAVLAVLFGAAHSGEPSSRPPVTGGGAGATWCRTRHVTNHQARSWKSDHRDSEES
ncbi:acyl-CoA carboxylase subunit epsilon [Streptomyces spinosirectus]